MVIPLPLNARRWEVEVGALSYMARGHKLSPLFKLTFRRTSLQHPLLAGALGEGKRGEGRRVEGRGGEGCSPPCSACCWLGPWVRGGGWKGGEGRVAHLPAAPATCLAGRGPR